MVDDQRVGAAFRAVPIAGIAIQLAPRGFELRGADVSACEQRAGPPRYKFPRRACSISIASKSALKLPTTKPLDPWRSMISKKKVGRSWMGRVKIWRR